MGSVLADPRGLVASTAMTKLRWGMGSQAPPRSRWKEETKPCAQEVPACAPSEHSRHSGVPLLVPALLGSEKGGHSVTCAKPPMNEPYEKGSRKREDSVTKGWRFEGSGDP